MRGGGAEPGRGVVEPGGGGLKPRGGSPESRVGLGGGEERAQCGEKEGLGRMESIREALASRTRPAERRKQSGQLHCISSFRGLGQSQG